MANKLSLYRSTSSPYYLILAIVFITHWPLLLSDSVLGDSIINYDLAISGHHHYILSFYNAYALPIHGYVAYLLSFLPGIFFYKLTAFACLVIIAFCLFSLFDKLRLFNRHENLLAALLAITFPVYSMWNEITTLPYLISYACFLGGFYFYLKSRWFWLFSLPLWGIAFQLSSLLLFFYAVLVGIWIIREKTELTSYKRWFRIIKQHITILIFPIAYFLAFKLFFPASQYQYNTISLSLTKMVKNLIVSAYGIFIEPYSHFFHFVTIDWKTSLLIVAVLSIAISFIYILTQKTLRSQSPSSYRNTKIMAYALALLICAVIPYVLAGKPVRGFGYESRHGLLLGPGMAMILIVGARWIFKHQSIMILWIGLGLFISMNWTSHILWQNRYIKIQAITENLAHTADTSERVIFFYDKVPLGSRFKIKEIELHYSTIQASGMYNQYPYLLNTDYTSLVKRIYSPPINWYKAFCYPWIMDRDKNQELLISPKLKQRLVKVLQREHTTKINRTYQDIHMNGFADSLYGVPYATAYVVHELIPGKELEEGKIFLQYISSNGEERKALLRSLLHVKTYRIERAN